MNLVDQIFEQAKAGSAQGQGFGQFFAEGVSAGQRQQQINQQQQQLAMEIAQAPLKQTLLQQDAALKAAQTEALLYENQTRVQSEQALAGLAGKIKDVTTEATVQDALPYFLDAVRQHPRIIGDDRFQRMWQDYNTSLNAKIELQNSKNNSFAGPEIREVFDKNNPSAPPIPMVREGPNKWTPLKDPTLETPTPQMKNAKRLTELKTAEAQALASGDPAKIAQAQQDLQSFIEVGPPTDTITLDPATGKFVIEHGRPSSALPAGSINDIQKRLGAGQRTAENITNAIGKINPNTVGLPGIIGENWEWIGNTLNPGSVPTTITDARETFRIATHNIIQSLKTDSQISTYERKALDQVADISGLKESDPTARTKYNTLLDLVGLQGALDAHRLKQPAPEWALRSMSLDQSKRAFARGDITRDEVRQWWKLHPNQQ